MPELPEVEAWRQQLDPLVERSPVEQAGPAHIATLKTFDPPLRALDGRTLRVERRAKRFLLPTDDGELVLMVHLMSAGRLKYVPQGAKGAKTPMFRLRFADGGELQLTEAGSKKRAGVWLLTRSAVREELAHLVPGADQLANEDVARILASGLAPAPFAAPRPAADRRHRPRVGERDPVGGEALPYALSTQVDDAETEQLTEAIRSELARGLELRLAGAKDAAVYRIHNALGQPCPRCGTPLARVDFEEHTIYYCPTCQTGGRTLKDRRLSAAQ